MSHYDDEMLFNAAKSAELQQKSAGSIAPEMIKSVMPNDPVNHPKHYTNHPSGIECIEITEHMSFNLGNALKYIWRCDLKKDAIEDLKKAKFYIEREIALRGKK